MIDETRKSVELNNELKNLVCCKMVDNLKEQLEKLPHNILCTDKDGNDRIFGYYYDNNGILVEKQVKGILLSYDEIWVYLDEPEIVFTEEDLLDDDKAISDNWFHVFGGSLLGWFTLININELLHEYVD